jgi:hypothetical protein
VKDYETSSEAAQVAQAQHDALARFAILANLSVTLIVIFAMWFDSGSALVGVVSGVVFFLVFGCVVILALTGTIKDVAINGQNQKTLRQMHQLQYHAQITVERPVQGVYSLPVDAPLQLPDTPCFVPAVPPTEDMVRVDAMNFVAQLFDRQGQPLPQKITPRKGQIQHKSPSNEAVEYLLALEIVRRGDGGQLYWNNDAYSGYLTRDDAIRAIRTGVRRASWGEGVGVGSEVGEGAL